MTGWCWHRWSTWVDTILVKRYTWPDEKAIEEPAQERRCLKCNKLIARKVAA